MSKIFKIRDKVQTLAKIVEFSAIQAELRGDSLLRDAQKQQVKDKVYEFLIKNNQDTKKAIQSYKKYEKPQKDIKDVQIKPEIPQDQQGSKKFKGLETLKMLEKTLKKEETTEQNLKYEAKKRTTGSRFLAESEVMASS